MIGLLLSRKLTGNFPDYERVLPKEHGHSVTLEREELRGAIERVAQFSDERSRGIRVRVEKDEMKIHSSVSETGESEESIPTAYEGPAVEIGFNAQYMMDFLRAVRISRCHSCSRILTAPASFARQVRKRRTTAT